MFHHKTKCGHCQQISNFVFEYIGDEFERVADQVEGQKPPTYAEENWGEIVKSYSTAYCPLCFKPNMFLFNVRSKHLHHIRETFKKDPLKPMGGLNVIHITKTYPKPFQAVEHPHWPEGSVKLFVHAQEMSSRNDPAESIVVSCRSVLEVAVKELGAKGSNLASKIDDLAAKGMITEAMKQWSHRVRIAGNEAVHEISATHEEARQLIHLSFSFWICASPFHKQLCKSPRPNDPNSEELILEIITPPS